MSKSILHIVSQSPFSGQALAQCLRLWQSGDAIVLTGDGTYGALSSQPLAAKLTNKACYVQQEDLKARGLHLLATLPHCEFVDDDSLVDLCATFDLVQSWY